MRHKTLPILLGLFLVLLIPTSQAVTMSISEPLNTTYSYSINLPIAFVTTNSSSCYWTIDDGVVNTSFSCSALSATFDVDRDGTYELLVYAENASDTAFDAVNLSVDRSDLPEAQGSLLIALIFGLLAISGIMMLISHKLDRNLSTLMFFGAWSFVLVTLNVIMLLVREFIKLPALINLLEITYQLFLVITILVAFIIAVLFALNFAGKLGKIKPKDTEIW